MQRINTEAFRDSSIVEVNIPNKNVKVGSNAFPPGAKVKKQNIVKLTYNTKNKAGPSSLEFSFFSITGLNYVAEVTQDLKQWGELETYKGNGKSIKFTDQRLPIVPFKRNFYRVRLAE